MTTILRDAGPPALSDEAVALEFARRHASDLRFVDGWGKWFLWTGGCWRADDTLWAFDLARAVCRSASAGVEDNQKLAAGIASAKTVRAVINLARADRRLAATTDQWDADPWVLITKGARDGSD